MRGAVDERAARGAGDEGEGAAVGRGLVGFVGRRRVARKIRRKMIVLHTLFSLLLAGLLVPASSVVVGGVAREGASREASVALALAMERGWPAPGEVVGGDVLEGVELYSGDAGAVGIGAGLAARAEAAGGGVVRGVGLDGRPVAVAVDGLGVLRGARVGKGAVGDALFRLRVLVIGALLGVYGLIVLALELLVLPGQVYGPIERLRRADAAVVSGDESGGLIPESEMPRDEIGEIMRSRNDSVLELRRRGRELGEALQRIELVAAELKEKTDLIDAARRNMADQERLVSLGMMSAGIAHELNTPLAVLKGSVAKLAEDPSRVDAERVALMGRVVGRLERLGDSLLDFARLRPPVYASVDVREMVGGAWELVSLDRDAKRVVFTNDVESGTTVMGDGDRLSQVFVNLLRNAVDASGGRGLVRVSSCGVERVGRGYLMVSVSDDGPGISREVMDRLFEPFASTRLDAQGTGLGLAVSEGIVREHGGAISARNNEAPRRGATFEVLLPASVGGVDGGVADGVRLG